MKKDPTEFRNRFEAWKNGEQVYEAGLPKYKDGKEKINYKRWDNAELTSYPVPFIKDKRITLTNAGRATGAVLSTNLLDSLADNAVRGGLDPKTMIGISTKETTLGNPTDDRSAFNLSSGIRQQFNGKYPGTEQHINYWGDALNEREDVINYHKGHQTDDPRSGGKSVLQEAAEFFSKHPDSYNPGQSGYAKLVKKVSDEVWQSPEIKRWYNAWTTKNKLKNSRWNRVNPLLKESKFNLPKFAGGTEGSFDEQHPITTPIRAAENAVKFAKKYYKSEGFEQRFKNINKATKGFLYSQYNPAAFLTEEDGYRPYKHTWSIEKKPIEVNSITPTTGSNAYYNPYTKSIKFGDSGTLKLGIVKTWDEVMAHEAGHALEDAIKLRNSALKEELDHYNNGYGYPYANIYPIFRKSKSYQKVRNFFQNYGDPTDLKLYEHDPSYGTHLMRDGELHHDAIPSESYADLFQMRKMLYDQKIFDSTKAGIKFTKEHLDKFKKKNHIRLQDNFSDDDIIWMINNVASNRTHTDNEV